MINALGYIRFGFLSPSRTVQIVGPQFCQDLLTDPYCSPVASVVINANHSVMCATEKFRVVDGVVHRICPAVLQPTKGQRIADWRLFVMSISFSDSLNLFAELLASIIGRD